MIYKCERCGNGICIVNDYMVCGICKKIMHKSCLMKHFPCDGSGGIMKEQGKEPLPNEDR